MMTATPKTPNKKKRIFIANYPDLFGTPISLRTYSKKYKAGKRCEILTIVVHVLQLTAVILRCCFGRRSPGNVQDL